MALAFVECPGTTGKASTVVVNLSGANAGDLLVAITGSENVDTPTISGSGWTSFERVTISTVAQVTAWYKIAGASEPTSITFTYSGGVNNAGAVWRGTGFDATPFNHDSGGGSGTDTTAECGTAGGSGAAGKIAYAFFDNTTALSSWSSGYTNRADLDSGNCSMYVADDLADGTSESAVCTVTGTVAAWVGSNSAWDSAGLLLLRRRQMEYAA